MENILIKVAEKLVKNIENSKIVVYPNRKDFFSSVKVFDDKKEKIYDIEFDAFDKVIIYDNKDDKTFYAKDFFIGIHDDWLNEYSFENSFEESLKDSIENSLEGSFEDFDEEVKIFLNLLMKKIENSFETFEF